MENNFELIEFSIVHNNSAPERVNYYLVMFMFPKGMLDIYRLLQQYC